MLRFGGGVTLNSEKCASIQRSIKFQGHLIDQYDIRANPDKYVAIGKMETLTMAKQLEKFLLKIAECI